MSLEIQVKLFHTRIPALNFQDNLIIQKNSLYAESKLVEDIYIILRYFLKSSENFNYINLEKSDQEIFILMI